MFWVAGLGTGLAREDSAAGYDLVLGPLGHSEVTNEFANKFACRACRAVARNL